MSALNCQLDQTNITVGQKAKLTCDTKDLEIKDKSSAKFITQEPTPFIFQFIGTPLWQDKVIEQRVTSYKVGQHELSSIKFSVDGVEYVVSKLQLEVKSVIEKPESS